MSRNTGKKEDERRMRGGEECDRVLHANEPPSVLSAVFLPETQIAFLCRDDRDGGIPMYIPCHSWVRQSLGEELRSKRTPLEGTRNDFHFKHGKVNYWQGRQPKQLRKAKYKQNNKHSPPPGFLFFFWGGGGQRKALPRNHRRFRFEEPG
jgi:hypothetical protein